MYYVIALISSILRTFVIPNPFEDYVTFLIINLLFDGILSKLFHRLIYFVVGLFYDGEVPVVGSILYFIFYNIFVGLIYLIAKIGGVV